MSVWDDAVAEEQKIMEEVKKGVISMKQKMGDIFHKVGFWFIILILTGAIAGGSAMSLYQKSQMDNAILLGGLVYKTKVFDIKERIR